MKSKDKKAWISTSSVQKFFFLSPRAEDILIEDIAHSLSLLCRFGGHCKKFYSVAEHSVLMSVLADEYSSDPLTALAALLHDAEEAYLPDIPRPVKQLMPEAKTIYKKLNDAIVAKFFLEDADWALIKIFDDRLCVTEAQALGLWNEDWDIKSNPIDIKIHGWHPRKAERIFLKTFKERKKQWVKSLRLALPETQIAEFFSREIQT